MYQHRYTVLLTTITFAKSFYSVKDEDKIKVIRDERGLTILVCNLARIIGLLVKEYIHSWFYYLDYAVLMRQKWNHAYIHGLGG